MGKQFFLRSAFALAVMLIAGCDKGIGTSDCCEPDPTYHDGFTFSSAGLLPFQNKTNWWKYSATGGHSFSISVLDTITDNHVTYSKVSFGEKDKDTMDNWFRRSSLGTEHSLSLRGSYSVFLPDTFISRGGTFMPTKGSIVSYAYLDSSKVNGTFRKKVMKLNFSIGIFAGFDEIDLAEGLGIIRMVDTSGRFPLTYSMDSARINGVIYK